MSSVVDHKHVCFNIEIRSYLVLSAKDTSRSNTSPGAHCAGMSLFFLVLRSNSIVCVPVRRSPSGNIELRLRHLLCATQDIGGRDPVQALRGRARRRDARHAFEPCPRAPAASLQRHQYRLPQGACVPSTSKVCVLCVTLISFGSLPQVLGPFRKQCD